MHKTNHIAILGLLSVTFLLSSFSISSVSAASATITTNNNITLNTSSAGNGVTIDEESINITTTCNKGYDLTIATSTSTNLYLNGDSTATAAYTAVDGTSALNSTNNTNKWGYTTTSNPTSSTIFSPLSTTASTIRTIAQTTSLTSETIPIYYGIKTDNTIDPGTYSMGNNGVITYYLTMNPLCYVVDIAYDGNNADAGTMGAAGTGVIHTGVKDGDTINLIASNFSKDGYGFAGWSLDPDAGTKLLDNDNTNNPIVYGPQETITLPEGFADNDTDNDGIVKLYAVWLQSQGNLQGWMGCSSLDATTYDSSTGALDLTKNSVTALTDQRDNDTYAIAKLADGECWMIENLRLESTAEHNSDGTLAQGYGTSTTYGNFSGLADAESTSFYSTYSANSLYSNDGSNDTINIGTSNYPGYRMPRYNNLNTSTRASDPTNNSGNMYSYGNYYTWHAAIADLTYNGTDNQSTTGTSLCPAGWHLPKGGNNQNTANNEFLAFSEALIGAKPANYDSQTYPYYTGTPEGSDASNKLRAYPNNFLYSGYFNTSSARDRGSYGFYWSSTAYGGNNSYRLLLYSSGVYPGTGRSVKYDGYSIRCTASDPVTYTLTYDANGGSDVPSSQSTTANGSATFTISSATPTRSGYTFAGWTDDKGNEVQPGGTFTTKDPNATLYAIWTNNSCNPTATTIGTGNTTTDAVCLQDVKPGMKSSLPTADSSSGTYSLIDARDGQSYTVAKLADGELWLTKNLNYGSGSDVTLTPYDTDLTSGTIFVLPATDTTSYTATTNLAKVRLTNNSGTSDNGVYYSWAAAVANTNSISTNPTTSICPKNWDLPTSAQYTNLKNSASYSSSNLTTAAPSTFLATGGFTNGATFYGATNYGHYWTSASTSSTVAYYARLTTSDIIVGSSTGTSTTAGGNKYYRKNIRCIASNGTATINYNGNGTAEHPVTGTTASQENAEINSANTQANGFTRTGWAFSGWNTAADGTGTSIAASAAISNLNPTPGSTITLYAQWLPQYTITYVNNCQTYASANSACTNAVSSTTDSSQKINLTNNPSTGTETSTLAAYNKWTLTGWKIKGWSTVADNSDNTNTEYGVGTTYTVPAGSSVGSGITLYAHWVPVYSIQYDGNGASNPNGMGTTNASTGVKSVTQTNVGEGDPVTLLASNFKRAGYGFAGWSTNPNATVTSGDKIYGPMETISAPAYPTNGTNIITMYAVWVPAEKSDPSDPSSSPLYLQDFTASNCNALTSASFNTTTGEITPGSVIALTDKRDDEVYTIAKLADDNCWMIENLRLEHESTVGNNKNDTSVTNQSLSQGYGGTPGTYGSFVGLANPESANFSNSTTSNSIYKSSLASPTDTYNPSTGTLEDIGNSNYPGYRFPRYNNSNNSSALQSPTFTEDYTNAASPSTSGTYKTSTVSSYGNYYTWAAAMANTKYYTSLPTSEAANTSICPSNWHLPSSGITTKEYIVLSQRYGGTGSDQSGVGTGDIMSNRFRSFPNNFLYSGYFDGSSAYYRGSYGRYWSRSVGSRYYSYNLYLRSTYLHPSYYDGSNKYLGFSVRCLIGS